MTATELDTPTLHFAEPLPGFGLLDRFHLVPIDEAGIIMEMRAIDNDNARFVVVPSVAFFPTYEPIISDTAARMLELTEAEDALVLVIVTVGATVAESTANLLAPIIINRNNLLAAQVILEDTQYDLRAPLIDVGR